MNIQTANQLFSNGTLSEMYKAGFITEKFFTYREIYLWVYAQMQNRNLTKNKAVIEAQGKFQKMSVLFGGPSIVFRVLTHLCHHLDKLLFAPLNYANQHIKQLTNVAMFD